MQKVIEDRSPLAPIEAFLTINTENRVIILAEHHNGTKLTELVKAQGICVAIDALRLVYYYLKTTDEH